MNKALFSIDKLPTNIKSSSAPLKRKITGRYGTQPESTISLAISSIDAEKGENKTNNTI